MLEFQGPRGRAALFIYGVLYVLGVQKFLRDNAERIGAPSPDYRDLSIVDSPKLGLVNLPGDEAREIVEQDRAALLPRFLAAEQQTKDRFPHAI